MNVVAPTPLTRPLAVALLAGTALLGVGAVLHPMLAGDAAARLRTIAGTPYWRTLHLVMLAGSALVVAGVWVRATLERAPVAPTLLAALAVISIGLTVNALDTAYMSGAGWHLAALYAAGRTDVVPLFEVTSPIGLMAARFGNAIVALGAVMLALVEGHDATSPRWMAPLAWLAAAGGFVGVLFFEESSRATFGAVALLSAWQVATGLRAWRGVVSDG